MIETDLMAALRESYREVQARKTRFGMRAGTISSLRRYLLYSADLLDIFINIQRDRRWRREE